MNRLFIFLATTTLVILATSPGFSQTNHIGLWKGTDNDEVGYVNMDSLGFAYFIIKGDTLGGESFTMKGQKAAMKYEISNSSPLKSIDFVIYLMDDKQEIGRLPGIFKFDENNNLVLCLNFKNQDRPTEFTEGDTILFEKINTVHSRVDGSAR